jgi:hypothetical protein
MFCEDCKYFKNKDIFIDTGYCDWLHVNRRADDWSCQDYEEIL